MAKNNPKNLPSLKLTDLLRRRRMTLVQYINQFGITTYEGLKARCSRMGVLVPTNEEFMKIAPAPVNSPAEGVVVLEAPIVIRDLTGEAFDPDDEIVDREVDEHFARVDEVETIPTQKKQRKKKIDVVVE